MKDNLLKIIKHYGINNQQRKLEEEVFELQEAITIHELKQSVEYDIPLTEIAGTKEHISEEIADILVLLGQIIHYYDIDKKEIKKFLDYKIERQLRRIENKNYNHIEKITVSKEDNSKRFIEYDDEKGHHKYTIRKLDEYLSNKINELIKEVNKLKKENRKYE